MQISYVEIANFRKLKSCRINLSEKETVFVGANNSGKTTAMDALITFLKIRKLTTMDFTLSNWKEINEIGKLWINPDVNPKDLSIDAWQRFLPHLDVWLKVEKKEVHYVSRLIPTLDWDGGMIGVRLRFEPKNIEGLYRDFADSHASAKHMAGIGASKKKTLPLWPKNLWDFLERRLNAHFQVSSYLLDPKKVDEPVEGIAKPQLLLPVNHALDFDPFKGLIKVDIINAQRNFRDPNMDGEEQQRSPGNLSAQLRDYYTKHLNPDEKPGPEDLDALQAMEDARNSFDDKLSKSFAPSISELEGLNYPGFGGNPGIKLSTKLAVTDGLRHSSAVTFEVMKSSKGETDYPLNLPEKYNGLGYQNLISMVFKLIRFRDEWMQVGKSANREPEDTERMEFQPLHLVLVEEPEAHLHAQVQQVFIKKAYSVLRFNPNIEKYAHFQTQLVVSTHSNHIAHEIEFTSLRYFKRSAAVENSVPTSTIINLSTTFGDEKETTKFAIRYLRTTHCDLFFADAVILIEGPAERMLVPYFIKHYYPELSRCYIALLEIGGSHSHTLRPLLSDLGIITLIITDIDAVDPAQKGTSVLPEKGKGYLTNNSTLKSWIPRKETIDELIAVEDDPKDASAIKVVYQIPILKKLPDEEKENMVIPYTFEIALALENIDLFRKLEGNGLIKKFHTALNSDTIFNANTQMFDALKKGKKAEFALELLYLEDPKELKTPGYITKGLEWLKNKLITITK